MHFDDELLNAQTCDVWRVLLCAVNGTDGSARRDSKSEATVALMRHQAIIVHGEQRTVKDNDSKQRQSESVTSIS